MGSVSSIIGKVTSLAPLIIFVLVWVFVVKAAKKSAGNTNAFKQRIKKYDGSPISGDFRYDSPDLGGEKSVKGESHAAKPYSYEGKTKNTKLYEDDEKPKYKKSYEYKGPSEAYGMTLKERRKMRFCEDGRMHCPYCGAHIKDSDESCRVCKKKLQA